jgi:hypothetical protein
MPINEEPDSPHGPMTIVLLTSLTLTLAAVSIHYTALVLLSMMLHRPGLKVRRWVAVSLFGALLAHVLEILVFAVGYLLLESLGNLGKLVGDIEPGFSDYAYFSFVAYTSLGFGDITPTGPLRFLTAIETLTGLVLIAWTASFIFVEMNRLWHPES